MTSHAQRVDAPPGRLASRKRLRNQDPTGTDKPEHDGEGDSVSVAKMGMIGTIGAALVTAVTTIVLVVAHDDGSDTTNSGGQTIKPTLVNTSPLGSFDEAEVTVTGSAEKNVDSVVVLIGAPPSIYQSDH
ncbi:MAG: hypothetical protein WBR28_25075 [Mycobacterium sp.]